MSAEEHLPPRRSSKPLMEKRRRARINDSLLQLKNLVLDALQKNNPRHSKLEKADILEMTVRYLRSINRPDLSGITSQNEQASIAQYQNGYTECMHEVSRYLDATSNSINASNQTVAFQNLMNMEASERHLQTNLLHHLVTQNTDYDRTGEKWIVQGQKNAAIAPKVVESGDIPTLQLYMTSERPSLRSLKTFDAPAPCMKENTERGKVPKLAPPSSVFYDGSIVAPVNPTACPSVNQASPMVGEGIRLVLPRNLVYSGQIPTHVIPVYAPTISTAQIQQSTVVPSMQSLSSSKTLTLAPVAPGDGHASNLSGSDVAPASGCFSFTSTPPPSSNHPPVMGWTGDPIAKSRQASAPTSNDKFYKDDIKSLDKTHSVISSSFSIPDPVSSPSSLSSASSAHDNTSQPPSSRNTLIKQSSQSHSHNEVSTGSVTENTTLATPPYSNQHTFRTVVPTQTSISPIIQASGRKTVHGSLPVTDSKTSVSQNFGTESINSNAIKRQRTTISQDTQPLQLRNDSLPSSLPRACRTGSNKDSNKTVVSRMSRADMPPVRCRSPHRSRSIPDQPIGRTPRPPRRPRACPDRNENAPVDVNALGCSPHATWRPW